MPIDPVIHAHMTYLVQKEKKAREHADGLEDEIELWKKRVRLAEDKGMPDLADEARGRARQLIAERRELEDKLDLMATEKRMLVKESRRPSGEEVARAEALLERWKESGLVDPDEAVLEREFDEMEAEMALEEFKKEAKGD
ncbi:hypothetical protein FIV42_12810 [Persicimonas caeni]|uniref:Uncharacterized protein n=1 Tax=Persicimonas caeni TaxID=2292766 RepID=A0A4Y6PV19_PERCE|nr:hypothetical protein [Persicimonas caeni]QDG51595.1 hypothetical protein FIV42_12810 [Persicimonas caeni]QED32816.1 hypothetical protein FRD00_12805 [Persicimonas caeni]